EGPSSTKNSRSAISRLISLTATTLPNRFVSSLIVTRATTVVPYLLHKLKGEIPPLSSRFTFHVSENCLLGLPIEDVRAPGVEGHTHFLPHRQAQRGRGFGSQDFVSDSEIVGYLVAQRLASRDFPSQVSLARVGDDLHVLRAHPEDQPSV